VGGFVVIRAQKRDGLLPSPPQLDQTSA
jgi:hypothetical protein